MKCPQCNEPSGTRVMKAHEESGVMVHSRCYNAYVISFLELKRQRDKEATAARIRATTLRRAANVERRGTDLQVFLRDSFKDDNENDQEVARILWNACHRADQSGRILGRFKDDLANDPVNALSWSQKAFTAAASLQINKVLTEAFLAGYDADEIMAIVHDNVKRFARQGSSSMPTGNVMDNELAKEWASLMV